MRQIRLKPLGYSVWMETRIKTNSGKPGPLKWIPRSGPSVEWEMAVALTVDLTRFQVAWQIRDEKGEVKAQWSKEIPPLNMDALQPKGATQREERSNS